MANTHCAPSKMSAPAKKGCMRLTPQSSRGWWCRDRASTSRHWWNFGALQRCWPLDTVLAASRCPSYSSTTVEAAWSAAARLLRPKRNQDGGCNGRAHRVRFGSSGPPHTGVYHATARDRTKMWLGKEVSRPAAMEFTIAILFLVLFFFCALWSNKKT